MCSGSMQIFALSKLEALSPKGLQSVNLYEQIGEKRLEAIVERTYNAAFLDPMIGYLFLGKSKARIVEMQLKFLRARFGGPKEYVASGGKDLASAHRGLGLRKGHFYRRIVLLQEAMQEENLPESVQEQWLGWEKKFETLILGTAKTCSD